MDAPDYLSVILCELADSGVQFVVAGGVAAVLHGVERATIPIVLHEREIHIVSKRKLLALKQQIRPIRPKDELDISTLKSIMEQNED